MNKSGSANRATQARRAAAARRRGSKHYAEVQSKCPHENTERVQGEGYDLIQCSDCGLYL